MMPAPNGQAAPASDTQTKKRKFNPNPKQQKYYAVRAGFTPGVYTNWEHCQQQVKGFKKPACMFPFHGHSTILSLTSVQSNPLPTTMML
jgi:hypothetical protein